MTEKVVDAAKAGAVGDGTTLNIAVIQNSIDECAARGGCKLRFPAGRYLIGAGKKLSMSYFDDFIIKGVNWAVPAPKAAAAGQTPIYGLP